MRRLHGFLDNRHQVLAERCQVHFLAQMRAEGCDGPGSIILAAVETAGNDGLDV